MAGPAALRPPTYSGTSTPILRRAFSRLPALAAVVSLGLMTGGCAMSNVFGLGKFGFSKDDAMASAETTGSIPTGRLASGLPPEEDLVIARSAITEVLGMGRKDFSTSWENPKSGARGTVTPISSAYDQDGTRCHDFLASYINGRTETWMRGEACRQSTGSWEVKALKPWKRT